MTSVVSDNSCHHVSTGDVLLSQLLGFDLGLGGEPTLSLGPVIGFIILNIHSFLHVHEELGVPNVLLYHVVKNVGPLID